MKKAKKPIEIDGTIVLGVLNLAIFLSAIASATASDADYSFAVDSDWHRCSSLGLNYEEVYAFETASFYVNVCQKEGDYFYLGETKYSDRNSIFLPTVPLHNNRGFQAINGNVAYIVILPSLDKKTTLTKPAEAILTIQRNGKLVEIESSLNKYCHHAPAIAIDKLRFNSADGNRLATVPPATNRGWNLTSGDFRGTLPALIFNDDAKFDFYRLDGKLYPLATCNLP